MADACAVGFTTGAVSWLVDSEVGLIGTTTVVGGYDEDADDGDNGDGDTGPEERLTSELNKGSMASIELALQHTHKSGREELGEGMHVQSDRPKSNKDNDATVVRVEV
jgi:hypothetical protein